MSRYIFFIIILFSNHIFSQTQLGKKFVLDWEESTIGYGNQYLVVPNVKGCFHDAKGLPVYVSKWDVSSGSSVKEFKMTNAKYERVDSKVYKDLDLSKLTDDVNLSLDIVKSRSEDKIQLFLTPIILRSNVVYRLISFDIEYSLTSNRSFKRTQAVSNSVLSSGTWYKFSVDKTGLFKIDKSFLEALGINVSSINPKKIKIYGNGGAMLPTLNSGFRYNDLQQNSIFVSGESDNVFNDNDYVLFYAQGPDSWNVDPVLQEASHVKNIYSDFSYYFINVEGDNGSRVQSSIPVTGTPISQITSFDDYVFHEIENINLFSVGQQWLGETFNITPYVSVSFPFENIDNSKDLSVKVRGVTESYTTSLMDVRVNNTDAFTINYNAIGGFVKAVPNQGEAAINVSSSPVNVEIIYQNNSNPSAKAYLDYIELVGLRKLIYASDQFNFRSFDVANTVGIHEYKISGAKTIWDVSDRIKPTVISNQSANSQDFLFKANGGTLSEYVIHGNYYTPSEAIGKIQNQNIHALQDVDYLIVTQDYLIGEANRLADYHRGKGLTVAVVDLEEVYNEFASGSPDLTAIRDFTKYLYDNASSPENRVKYLCLFGDASYDYKDRVTNNNNIVPAVLAYESYNLTQSYITDDYYGMMDDAEGDLGFSDLQDIATGRIPVTTSVEAANVVSKILHTYGNEAFGDWRNIVTLVADDLDVASESVLQQSMEDIAVSIQTNKPVLNIKKIYADSYKQEVTSGGDRYPDVKEDISNSVEKGTLVVNYFGHGGPSGWAREQILTIPQIQSWNNYDFQPLIITITCEFSKFDDPLRQSGGELLVLSNSGGSGSLITTTREIFINIGRSFNEELVGHLFNYTNGPKEKISESMLVTKNNHSYTNQRLFIYYLGDPATELFIPEPDIKLTHINDVDVSSPHDSIKALSKIKLSGLITDTSGTTLTNYNGVLSATVYDKEISKITLDNDNHGVTMPFDILESKVFKGRATVTNGQFNFDFIAPRDLRIAYGNAKISFYAEDKVLDKSGYDLDVVIGGINENAPEDNIGPKIQVYLNDESFVDGSNTNESPLLLVDLEDESGINTSITAVDHDIVAIIDGDNSNPIILNDYYETELDDFTKGTASYQLRNLEVGTHTLELCAWDTYNNNSCSTLSFTVVNDADLVLDNVLNYPNPFINFTEFWFSHNKPNEPLEVQVQIFTISGKLIKTINKTVQSNGNLSRSVSWDGLDDFGDKIGKGVYVYKLSVRSSLSDAQAEKYEKLVILQ